MILKAVFLLLLFLTSLQSALLAADVRPSSESGFEASKILLRQHVYHDQNRVGDFYCGCPWRWVGRSAGRLDLEACGYTIRSQPNRAIRLEWEHIVPAFNFGRDLRCWQNGGRNHCRKTDPRFSQIEADPHNLVPAVGEINADRAYYRFGVISDSHPLEYGQCDFKVDFKNRVAQPRDAAKGAIARIYLYMHARYALSMSNNQRALMETWDQQFPVTDWELERDRRIASTFGFANPFVERRWHRQNDHSLTTQQNTAAPAKREIPAIPAQPQIPAATAKPQAFQTYPLRRRALFLLSGLRPRPRASGHRGPL